LAIITTTVGEADSGRNISATTIICATGQKVMEAAVFFGLGQPAILHPDTCEADGRTTLNTGNVPLV